MKTALKVLVSVLIFAGLAVLACFVEPYKFRKYGDASEQVNALRRSWNKKLSIVLSFLFCLDIEENKKIYRIEILKRSKYEIIKKIKSDNIFTY